MFHPAAPGGMLFQAAWASMKNSFMWKRVDGGNRRKRGNKGRKENRSWRKDGGKRKEGIKKKERGEKEGATYGVRDVTLRREV